jgi:hypothetical protein
VHGCSQTGHLGMANGHRPTKRGFDFWFGLPLSHDYGCTDHQVANFTYGAGWEYNSSPEGGCDPCPHSGPPPAAAPLSPTNSCNIGANNKWHISPPLFENEQIIEQPVDERCENSRLFCLSVVARTVFDLRVVPAAACGAHYCLDSCLIHRPFSKVRQGRD